MLLVVAAFIVAFVLLLYMISPLISPKPLKLNGAHVVVSTSTSVTVTGGSSGIGKGIAIECYRQGAFITLVARDEAQEKLGPVDMLINCAGTAISAKFEEMEVERFKVSNDN
ncbi:hypothetical protein GOODEAATRI_007897 [Goodea atripinnis]|uniref:3-ketodihydrosphingosine reductase n=1 Tax=Goodea atripinnis TaxID=208336 RepID=A0ABV0NB95_9TELE